MTAKKRSIKSDLTRVDAHRIAKAEYDEAPVLTKAMLDRAEIRHRVRIRAALLLNGRNHELTTENVSASPLRSSTLRVTVTLLIIA